MVLDPYRASDKQINSVWDTLQWEQPTGYFQAFRLPSRWSPYESIDFITDDYHIFFYPHKWTAAAFGAQGGFEEFVVEPPMLLVFARGQGETPAEIISTSREAAESLAGLLSVKLGNGYPVLTLVYEAVFRKDKIETIKYYPARSRIEMKGLTKAEIADVLAPLGNGVLQDLPPQVRLALRWYGKGVSEGHPADKFISLYECCLAIVSRWHYTQHPEAYEGHDAPPRRMFGDWVRDVLKPNNDIEEKERFRPFDQIVDKRNRIFKANDLGVDQGEVTDVTSCATQVVNWALSELFPR